MNQETRKANLESN